MPTTHLIGWPNHKTLTTLNADEDVKQQRFILCWWERKMAPPLRSQFLLRVNTLFPYDQVIVFLGVYPKELKAYVHTKNPYMHVLAPLFITV